MTAARDRGRVETGAVHRLPVRSRYLAVDERGSGLRATWHPDRGLVNLSLWRDDRCVETFHLTPAEAGRLVGFLVDGLADAAGASVGARPTVVGVPAERPGDAEIDSDVVDRNGTLTGIRRSLSNALDRIAAQIRQ